MDRHRRDSRDGGEQKERRRSKSRDRQDRRYSKGHEDIGANRSRSSRSVERSRSTRDNTASGDTPRKRSDDDSKISGESREKRPRDSDRANDASNSRKPSDDSKSSRGRDDAGSRDTVSHRGSDAGRSSHGDSSTRGETVKRNDSYNGGKSSDDINSRTDKKPRRSRSPSNRESTTEKKVNAEKPLSRQSERRDSRGEGGRNGELRDEKVDSKVRSVSDNDVSHAINDDRPRKGSGTREVDDHGRERKSRTSDSSKVESSSSSKREESSKDGDSRRRDSERNRGDGNDRVARGDGKGDRTEGRLQIADSLGTINGDWRSRETPEGKAANEGSSMRRHQGGPPRNPNQNQYGPGSIGDDFSSSDTNNWNGANPAFGGQELGRERGRGNREDFNGSTSNDMGMWGAGMGMGGAFAPKLPSFNGWGNGADERKGMGGAMPGEGFYDDWRQRQSQQLPHQEGSNNFSAGVGVRAGGGGQGGGDGHHTNHMDHYSGQPFGDFNQSQPWGWNQSQQGHQSSSYEHQNTGGGLIGGDKESGSSHKSFRQPRSMSISQDTPSAPQFKGSRQQREASKPPPPPPPPKLSGTRSDTKTTEKNRSRENDFSHSRKHSDRRMSICSNDSDKSRSIRTEESSSKEVVEEIPEVVLVPLKWALEDLSVLVSRRLAGNELYDRVLALRGIKATEVKAEEKNVEAEAKVEESVDAVPAGPTLDELLASVTQQKGEGSGDDNEDAQRAVVSVDDFFGAFAGGIQCSFDADAPPYDEDPPGDDDDVTSDNGDDVADEDGDDMYGDLGVEEGNAEDGDADDHDDNGSASAMLVADDNDFPMEASGKPSTDNAEVRGLSDVSKSAPHTVTRRDYSCAPPNVLEDVPYAMQDVSFTRLNIFSRALKGQGFSSFLLQSIPELKKLFRKDLKGKER